jgi:hypothetical protein
MRSSHGSSVAEAPDAGPVDLQATSRVSETLSEIVDKMEEHATNTPTLSQPAQLSAVVMAQTLESVSCSAGPSEAHPEAAVASEVQVGTSEVAQEKKAAQFKVTMLLGRARAWSSSATAVLNSVGAYAETLYPKVAVEQERSHSTSGRACPLLMTEAEFYGSSSSSIATLQSEVPLPIDEMAAVENVGVSPDAACPDVEGELSVSESSAESAYHSALDNTESVSRSSEGNAEGFSFEFPAVSPSSSTVSCQAAVFASGPSSANPASSETTDTNTKKAEGQHKKQAKRPIRRGGQWKKSRKCAHQNIHDIPDTDDGWSD